jgi:hypothetical protein
MLSWLLVFTCIEFIADGAAGYACLGGGVYLEFFCESSVHVRSCFARAVLRAQVTKCRYTKNSDTDWSCSIHKQNGNRMWRNVGRS